MPRLLGGFVSPSLRWWPSWWWSLHLRSFRCRLLDGSHYTRLANVRQIETIQTPHKPLQTLAFIGVSQPHDGDEKPRSHGHGHDGHDVQGTTWPRHARPRSHTKERASAIPHDTPKHNRTNVPTLHHATNTPRGGSLPPGLSAGAGGTIAEIVRGFLKSSRTKRDACNLSSRSTYGLQAFQNQVAQPLLHLFC